MSDALNASKIKFLYWASLIVFIYVAYLLIKPFIITVLTSGIIAYVFYPLFKSFKKYIKNDKFASFIVSTIIVLLVTIPSVFLIQSLTKEAYVIYSLGLQKLTVTELTACETSNIFCDFINLFGNIEAKFYLEQALEKGTSFILDFISSIALSIPWIIVNLFIILFITYYLFISMSELKQKIFSILPFNKNHIRLILKNLNDVTYSIVYGTFIVAILEALLGMLGFAFIGASSPVLWGLVIGFLTFIPMIGPSVVWVPAFIMQLYQGIYWKIAVIGITGVSLTLIDTFLKPIIMGDKADLNPALVLLGVLGGLNLFGIVGIILGPFILSFFSVLFKIYMQERIIV